MKKIKYIYKYFFLLLVVVACEEDLRETSFTDNMAPPSEVTASYAITQDNSGSVTITPTAQGAISFEISFGDNSDTATLNQGESVEHIYAEGTYQVIVAASNLAGDVVETVQQLVVSFQAPQNLVVVLENDVAISKQVNITTTADFAAMFEFNSGETGVSQPVVSGNIGETISYVYANPGTYSVIVTAKGGAIATTDFAVDFEVTEILAPTEAAPVAPARNDTDVVSIFSDIYTDVTLSELPTTWSTGNFEATSVDSDNVWKLTALDFLGIVTNYDTGIDLSGMEMMHIDYWVPEGTTNELFVKIVNTVDGGEDIESLGTTVGGSWQSIDIDMTGFDGGNLANKEKITQILIDSDGIAGNVYVDNFYFYKAPSSIVTSTVQDFEGTAPTFTVFGNIAATEVIANPDTSGINTSENVAKLTKTAGSEVWAGTFFETSTPLDFNNYSKISVKTWSPKTGAQVKLKLENVDASITHEVDMNTTVSNSWEEILYDFSAAPAADYVRVVVFFDFGNAGDDSVYYYDEINLVDDSGVSVGLTFQDFEGTAPTFTVFGNIAATEVITNPDQSGINTTANVAQLTKTAGSEVWAGTFFEVGSALDFNNYSKISVKTWSPKSGAVVKLKLENEDASVTHEVDLSTSVANSWEELIYDFSAAPAGDYIRVVVFFDFGNSGDDSVYYYDELQLKN
ncbi:PKD domain protein [Polaribacter sp.]|uniref:PKD domain protein n=1 Tax=Polaribacter sp. TaxID=1920175 RepID=UPI0025E9A17E|nr:PKD domain protein [Polaribacter sp.]